jgi:hypothetical protein
MFVRENFKILIMRKLITLLSLVCIVAVTIPSCTENDDFSDVTITTEMEKTSSQDDKKDADQGPGGGA